MKNILLVEDDSFLIDIYTTKLKQENDFSIEVAQDGKQCEILLSKKKFDLLLLDIVLPQMDGWEILRDIKKDSKYKDLKVVILSNLGEKENIEKGFSLGAVKYLIKSQYTPSQIVEEIKKLL